MADPNLPIDMHAVVTGGGRGIGAAISSMLALEGYSLSILSRSQKQLESHRSKVFACAKEQGLPEPKISCIACDVGKPEEIDHAFERAISEHGPVNILVNNAGFVKSAPFEKYQLALWEETINVNLRSVFLCMSKVLPQMKSAGFGRIINIASTAGITGYPYVAPYCAAKHGVMGLTRALGLELAGSGVTVNAICPGYTDTDLIGDAAHTIAAKSGKSAEDIKAQFLQAVPQGRFVEPKEIASAVSWLCQRLQDSITGQSIVISGGEVI